MTPRLSRESRVLTPSAAKVLRALGRGGPAMYEQLLIRVRPMSEDGMLRSVFQLDEYGLVRFDEHADGVLVSLTDAGEEAHRGE